MASTSNKDNFHIVLRKRPGTNNEPSEENFGYEQVAYPNVESMKDGDVLIKNFFLSVDPALRCFMNEDTGVEYAKPWELNETIQGAGGVGEVLISKSPNYKEGDHVVSTFFWPWKNYFIISEEQILAVPEIVSKLSPTLCLSAFGLTGLTAYLGVKEKGHVQKDGKQTMLVSAAAGSTGSLAGQIAKAEGCEKVVGICGLDEKCRWLKGELGFDDAINYKSESVANRIPEICPLGVDIYFDNVGGEISDEVIQHMNKNSHIILCGQISKYNTDAPYPPPVSEKIKQILKERNITRDRFLVLNYKDQFDTAIQSLIEMYMTGALKVRETVEKGLQNAGKAFTSMMKGGNIGKQLVQVFG